MNKTKINRLRNAFENHFFTVDGGAVLTSSIVNEIEETVECSETNELGEIWETTFTFEELSNAVIEGSKVFIVDTNENECVVEFYSSTPILI